MYLGNTVLMYWLTHKMFKFGSFAEYGLLWDSRNPLNNVQSLIQDKLFPKVAACEVKRFGASGELNLNQKFYQQPRSMGIAFDYLWL